MGILQFLEQENKSLIPEQFLAMDRKEMEARVLEIRDHLGDRLFLPVHHYQKDEIVQFADTTGDSLQLAQVSASNKKAEYIVFCGVHFMAETADILTGDNQKVYLPDMRAGCSMADMADIFQTERAWEKLQELFGDTILPLTYVNSTAAIKAFVGKNGGATVTSSNAHSMIKWAFEQKEKILFLPDQHLGRNTAFDIGIPLEKMAVWDPIQNELVFDGTIEEIKVILWKGHCSVHEKFTVQNIQFVREKYPNMKIIVHPECSREVVELSDYNGSTKYIIDTIAKSEPGTEWAIGTEMNLVNRLIQKHEDKHILSLNPHMCPCLTMNRIDLPHLLWNLESIVGGQPINQITVDEETSKFAILALNRMLQR
ncbi:quinolinate synthase NadA [Bacillus sp. FJAT-49736]|uniref:quinolinate synthase NadA n=1 Tax=Bacillus sp. FJAT-49736 TaxID=2833582 RepID=UPI001BC990D0|nr:quinolinate synthase NadA [Bacillus sp. FJAT-49736]MBS4173681.1 quinolinate synthase NadA [Bacillus sp. FJAT-49736]